MRQNRRIDRRLATCFALSLLAHAMIALAIGANVFPSVRAQPPPPAKLDQSELTPGVDRSGAVTINWIGFEDPTPHQAKLAATDQPALVRGPDTAPAPEVSPSSPTKPDVVPLPIAQLAQADPRPASPILKTNIDDRLVKIQQPTPKNAPSKKKSLVSPKKTPQKQASQPAPAPDPAPIRPPTKAGGGKRESPPTSQTKPIRIKPGQPVAMQGLRIDTIAPKFTTITRLTAFPHNPLVKLTFNAAGRVTRAEVLESSGDGDVDRPVLDALYNWRAHGVKLVELRKKDPKKQFSLEFRIVLR